MGNKRKSKSDFDRRHLRFPPGRLRQLMREHDMEAADLQQKFGVSLKTIYNWMDAKVPPRRTRLNTFLKVFRVSTDKELYGDIYDEIPNDRRECLTGQWHGTGKAQGPGKPKTPWRSFKVCWELRILENEVLGRSTITFPDTQDGQVAVFNLKGGFIHDRFCQLNYLTKEVGAIRFGSIIAELDCYGKHLSGCYTGFSVLSNSIVYGIVELSKDGLKLSD